MPVFAGLGSLLLAACSHTNIPPAPAGYPALNPSSITLPTVHTLVATTAFKPVQGDAQRALSDALREPHSALGGTYNNGHGYDGYMMQAPLDENHATFMAVHSVWAPGSDVVLNQPPANGNTYFLYAPTTHPPNSCIEAGTAYATSPNQSGTQGYIYFYDFCKDGGAFTWFMNDSVFRAYYAFWDSGVNAPSIAVLITTLGSSLDAPDWNAYVWSPVSGQWELFYQSAYANRTSAPPAQGWSIFEPNFQPQPTAQSCRQPRTPVFSADNLKFYNIINGNVTPVDGSTAWRATAGACVMPDASGGASFSFAQWSVDWRWQETATGQ